MLSRVGNDDLGQQLINKINEWGLSTEYIQIDKVKPTSTVVAKFDKHNDAVYKIIEDVAWDFIEQLPLHNDLVSNAEAFIYGTLSSRNETTRNTLFDLLEIAKFRVFDVNFRPPFTDTDLIKQLLHKADLIKMNKAELKHILEFLKKEYTSEEDGVMYIQEHFSIPEAVLTKGSKGARYFFEGNILNFESVPVEIKDTVGSGDSFLAGFLSKRLVGEKPENIMRQAISLGAFITSQSGACPDYSYEQFRRFRNKNYCTQ